MPHTDRSDELIKTLGLRFLNVEAGLFSLVRVSDIDVSSGNEESAASNAIYLMLNRDQPINYLQWLYSDDYQVLIEGGPADYYLFYEDGSSQKLTMGRDLQKDQRMVVAVPGGTAKAIRLHEGADFILMASILSPAWSPHRTKIGGDQVFVDKFAGSSVWANPKFISELIGPNFGKIVGGVNDSIELSLQKDGQIICQEMQLTLKQVRQQMIRFKAQSPDTSIGLKIEVSSPLKTKRIIESLAEDIGVSLEVNQAG